MDLYDYCHNDDREMVLEILKESLSDIDYGLRGACRGGHMELVKLLIEKGATNFNEGLCNACVGGHLEIVELMINKEANNFEHSLVYCCLHGHIELVNLMIEKGATNFNEGLINACVNGHEDIVKLLISKGADDFNGGLRYSQYFSSRYKNLALLMLENKANINECIIGLDFDDIYYLLHKRVNKFGKFSNIADKCKKFKQEYNMVLKECIIVEDVIKLMMLF